MFCNEPPSLRRQFLRYFAPQCGVQKEVAPLVNDTVRFAPCVWIHKEAVPQVHSAAQRIWTSTYDLVPVVEDSQHSAICLIGSVRWIAFNIPASVPQTFGRSFEEIRPKCRFSDNLLYRPSSTIIIVGCRCPFFSPLPLELLFLIFSVFLNKLIYIYSRRF